MLPLCTAATTGFYSGAAQAAADAAGLWHLLPGAAGAFQRSAAGRCGGPLLEEWKLVSAHGCACDPVAECLTAGGKPVFFLTGGAETPASLCGRLAAAGLGDAHVLVGEELGRAEEKILFGRRRSCAKAVCKPECSACGASSSAAPAGARLPG